MNARVTHIFNPATFPAVFARNLGLGLRPTGVNAPSQLTWSSDYSLFESNPIQTLLHVPSLQDANPDLSRSMFSLRARLMHEGSSEYQVAQAGQRNFAGVFFELQNEISRANDKWHEFRFPEDKVKHRAFEYIEYSRGEEDSTEPLVDGRDALGIAIMLLKNSAEDKNGFMQPDRIRKNFRAAAQLLETSAAMYARVLGPDSEALLRELAHASYSKFFSMSDPSCENYGLYGRTLSSMRERAVEAWSTALGIQQEPAYDALRILGGIRACLSSPDHYRTMVRFLKRNEELYDATPENSMRIAWAYMASPQATQQDWESAVMYMDEAISKCTNASSSQMLQGLRNSVKIPKGSQGKEANESTPSDKFPDSSVRVAGHRNAQPDSQIIDSTIFI